MNVTPRNRFILFATTFYTLLGLAWIFFSDLLLSAFADIQSMVWLSTAKGVFFIVASAAAFFLALRAVPARETNDAARTLDLLSSGISPVQPQQWPGYLFAVLLPLLMLVMRNSMADSFGESPLLMMFMFPIILAALLGGLGPGLVATAVTAAGVTCQVMHLFGNTCRADVHDLIQWGFLIVNGVAVSLLSEMLRRSLAKAEFNHSFLDAIVSGTTDAVFVKDLKGRYLICNKAAAQFVKKQPHELLGQDDRFIFPEQDAELLMKTDRSIMENRLTQSHEEHLTTFDGRELYFLVTKGPVFDQQGAVVGLFGISHDITESRQVTLEIQRLNASLERRVQERTAALHAANLELESLNYAIAHNLHAPLRAISGFSQVLGEEYANRMDERALGYLDEINQGARQMGSLIDALLGLSRNVRGELQIEPVDVSALAEKIRCELEQLHPDRLLQWQITPEIKVSADARLMGVVLHNLLENAVKFTRNCAVAKIRVYAEQQSGMQCICVSDNGIGFDMRHSALLFQPFQRLHRQDEYSGIGIGLALVQQIMQRHGGTVQASASPGAGAVICFSLPDSRETLCR